MVTLLAAATLGILSAIFATQNTGLASLNFGDYTIPNIPIYLVVLIPLLIGIVLALLFHIARDLSQSLTISEQKDKIKNLKQDLAEVTKAEHKLEIENVKIKTENGEAVDENSI